MLEEESTEINGRYRALAILVVLNLGAWYEMIGFSSTPSMFWAPVTVIIFASFYVWSHSGWKDSFQDLVGILSSE